MHFYTVAVAAIAHKQNAMFTYHHPERLVVGVIVRAPWGKNMVTGVVTKKVTKPDFTTRPIETILCNNKPLPRPLLQLAEWLSHYYAAHPGLVWQTILPPGIHKKRRVTSDNSPLAARLKKTVCLSKAQTYAIKAITEGHGAFLLHGVPGSGKTQVYIEAAKNELAQGRSAIVLVPEIGLTTQLVAEFANYFAQTVVIHSKMTEAQRALAWQSILDSTSPMIVIGPRSALFCPLPNIGLIVIDECHEQSFKQDRSPKYNALYTGSALAKIHRAKIVLGSATPNVTELHLVDSGHLQLLELPTAIQPSHNTVQIIPHAQRDHFTKHRFISTPLIHAIEQTLAAGEQALVFHNRRGTTPSVICEHCGWQATCPTCHLPLTFHADHMEVRCHTCNYRNFIMHTCPDCARPTIVFKGIGTKLVASELGKLFPHARVARFDADNSKQDQLQQRYQELYDGHIDILVGTQIVAKGLDVPGISTVGILQADAGLHLPDFTATERTFQLLYQVSGRAGRSSKAGRVILQSYNPSSQTIIDAAEHNFHSFAARELHARQTHGFPPYRFLLLLTYSGRAERNVVRTSREFAQKIAANYSNVDVSGPAPAFHEHSNDSFRWQILVSARQRAVLLHIAGSLPSRWQFDIDPVSLL